jgi:CRISPR/Cas system-associated exonuclease Cas4 (RecB family)
MAGLIKNLRFKRGEGIDGNALADFVEEQYLKKRREPKFSRKYSFAPSAIGYGNGNCPRYWYLAFNGADVVDETDPLSLAIMSNGSSGHNRIQELFRESGILVSEEVEVKLKDPPVRGFIDVMIRWEDEVIVGEIKTTRSEAFSHRQLTMRPAANHLFQILVYMKATGKKNGFVLYENKNTQEILVIPVTMSDENIAFLEKALDWMRRTHKAYEDDVIPTRPWTKRNKICKECPMYKLCWEEKPDGELVIEPLELPKK